MNAAEGIPTKLKVRPIQQKARLPKNWTQGKEMTPDGCRGSFLWWAWSSGHPSPGSPGLWAWLRGSKKRGRKNPPQHSYHIIAAFISQRQDGRSAAKSVLCTKTDVCIWGTFHLEKSKNPCYLIVTKRRYLNSKSSGGQPKANGNNGNQSDFKSK